MVLYKLSFLIVYIDQKSKMAKIVLHWTLIEYVLKPAIKLVFARSS